jgi:hypothetical protein
MGTRSTASFSAPTMSQQIAVHAQVRDRDATVNWLAVDKIGECA